MPAQFWSISTDKFHLPVRLFFFSISISVKSVPQSVPDAQWFPDPVGKEIMSLLILSKSTHYSYLALSVLRLHYPWCLPLRLNEADLLGSFGNVCLEKCVCGQPVVLGQMGSSSSPPDISCAVSLPRVVYHLFCHSLLNP